MGRFGFDEAKKINLGNIIEQIRGVSYKPDDLHNSLDDDSVILLRANNIRDGKINFDDVVYVDRKKVSDAQYLQKGDILICASSGSKDLVGKAASFDCDVICTFGAFCKVVRPKEKGNYIAEFFQSNFYRRNISNVALGANINNIRNEHIDELKISLYPTDVEKKFVSTMQLLDKVIISRRQQLEELDILIKSRFIEMFGDPDSNPFGWGIETLEKHLDVVGGYAFKSDGFEDSGIPVLRIGNINSGRFLAVNMVYWSDDPALDKYKMYPGDLVMSLTGTVGKDDYGNVCILGEEHPVYYLNQRNAKLALKGSLNRAYLAELLKFASIKRRLTGISRGVRQANIANRDILQLCVPIPPLALQVQFAAFVQATDKSKSAIQKSLNELQTLFDSLMQEYFG